MKHQAKVGTCPVHNLRMVQRDGRFGPYYVCPYGDAAQCEWMGAFSEFDGRFHLSDKRTRAARIAAHAHFDRLWKKGQDKRMCRASAYAWLSTTMGIPPAECHIGHMSRELCEAVIRAVRRIYRDQKESA
ncbi:MAG: hypothetical protein IT364_24670 [Candidatus Hydrogenedentes bacterium]|nr:hypothetical protein [Candidatus Hydrogenedentota bacterium]